MENVIKKILNFDNNIDEIKDILKKYYISQYGEKYKKEIENRLDHTFFMMDSTPDINLNIAEDFRNLFDYDTYLSIKEEYEDYKKYYVDFFAEKEVKLRNMLAEEYKISPDNIKNNDLDIKDLILFTKDIEMMLDNPIVKQVTKNAIMKKKEEYLDKCKTLGIKPITDIEKIQQLLDKRRDENRIFMENTISKTIWGNRIKEKFEKNMNCIVTNGFLANCILQDATAFCIPLRYKNKDISYEMSLVTVPLFKIYKANIDELLLHEVRHAVENHNGFAGINFDGERYELLNEIRTQKHAEADKDKLPLFISKNNEFKVHSIYNKFYKMCKCLFEDNQEFFDEIALTADESRLKNIEGLLSIYSNKLEEIYKYYHIPLDINIKLDVDKNSICKIEKRLSKEIRRK